MNPQTIISRLGGTAKTAELCQVTPGAVSQWLHSGIPPARLMFLRLARPDVFEGLDAEDAEHLRESAGPMGRTPPDPSKELT